MFCLLFGGSAGGQYLNLDFKHLFNDAKFELNTEYINNNGHNLKFTRLNYYLSGFTITHDGGQTTTLKDTYLLVTEKVACKVWAKLNLQISKELVFTLV